MAFTGSNSMEDDSAGVAALCGGAAVVGDETVRRDVVAADRVTDL